MQDKTPTNEKGQYHGLCEDYWLNGNPMKRTHYINGEPFGLRKIYSYDGKEKIIYYFCI